MEQGRALDGSLVYALVDVPGPGPVIGSDSDSNVDAIGLVMLI